MVQTYSSSRFSTGVGLAGAKDPPQKGVTRVHLGSYRFPVAKARGPRCSPKREARCVSVSGPVRACVLSAVEILSNVELLNICASCRAWQRIWMKSESKE